MDYTTYVNDIIGDMLRSIHHTAMPYITRTFGVKPPELEWWETISSDSIDYLFGGNLTLKNGRIDRSAPNGDAFLRLAVARISGRAERIAKRRKKFQFDEGYCQATQYNATQDNFTFMYYDKDHLGNVLSRRYFNVTVTI